jgi:hypothetical protein
VWPHFASNCGQSSCPNYPPIGLRFRLKASFDTGRYHGDALMILTAVKRYGMFVADNGSNGSSPAQPICAGTTTTSTS